MTSKLILLTGLNPKSTEAGIREWLSRFGPVRQIDFVRDGNAAAPVAVVEMDITDGEAFFLVSRVTDYWHDGALVSARLMNH